MKFLLVCWPDEVLGSIRLQLTENGFVYFVRHLLASLLVSLSASGNFALSQQVVPQAAASDQDKPRIYVTDSNSWSVQGAAGGSNGTFAASSSGGARPQTAEIIKTFGQRCPQVITNNRVDAANYIVELDHEGGKGLLAHKDKIAVFVQKSGDSIFSKSTLSVGGSVEDACKAILSHWSAHASQLQALAARQAEVPQRQALTPFWQQPGSTSTPACRTATSRSTGILLAVHHRQSISLWESMRLW